MQAAYPFIVAVAEREDGHRNAGGSPVSGNGMIPSVPALCLYSTWFKVQILALVRGSFFGTHALVRVVHDTLWHCSLFLP